MKQRNKKLRYTVPDIIRGLAVISMIVYHTLWDLVYLFKADIPFMKTDAEFVFQQSICWCFILVSGFCLQLGRKKLKRGVIVLACAVVLTAVTALVMPENIIVHGVLSLIGTSMLITVPLERLFGKIHPLSGAAVSFLLFILTFNITQGVIGIGEYEFFRLPESLYANTVTAFFGFPHRGFESADYVPLFPWLFLFFTGYFLYSFVEKKGKLGILSAFSCRPLEFVGRHSLEIYMIHQPVIYAILTVVFAV